MAIKIFSKKNVIFLYLLNLIAFVYIFIDSISYFFIGFHNLDMGHNIKWLNCEYNTSLLDVSNTGEMLNHFELYSMGYNQMVNSFYSFGLACGMIVLCIFVLIKLFEE